MACLPNSARDNSVPDFWVGTDPELKFHSTKPMELVRYWRDKQGSRRMPSRADIDPLELRDHMGNLTLIDVENQPLRLRYRLIGTNITTVMARDATGYYYDELYSPDIVQRIYGSFDWLFEHKAPLRTHGKAYYPDKNFYDYEALNLPLSDDGETVNMILAELVFSLAPAR